MEKANAFAENFAKVSSDENYSPNFIIQRQQIAIKVNGRFFLRKPVEKKYEDSNALNYNFSYYELKRAIREAKRNSSAGDDQNILTSYSMYVAFCNHA